MGKEEGGIQDGDLKRNPKREMSIIMFPWPLVFICLEVMKNEFPSYYI